MKFINIFYFLIALILSACTLDEDETRSQSETVNMRIDHFRGVGTGMFPKLVYRIQEGDKIGSENWNNLYSEINGFTYEKGFVYDLKIKKMNIQDPPQDASSIKYELQEMISKTAVAADTQFSIDLKWVFDDGNNLLFVNRNSETGYTILDQLTIDCSDLCDDLATKLAQPVKVSGVFQHESEDVLKLIRIVTED